MNWTVALSKGESYGELRARLLARTDVSGPDRRRALARLTDGWLTELAMAAGATVGGVALVAIGGYGRSELSPFSDLDLILLHSSETPAGYAEMIAERLWYPIWDAGVRLDHSVQSVGGARQLARSDLPTLMALMDVRHIAGDPDLAGTLHRRMLADWRTDARERLPRLHDTMFERWNRSGDLAFATVPDLKESRGGLRDLSVMRAVAASWVADCPHQGLAESRSELLDVRDALHRTTGRPGDRVQVEQQDPVAARLGLPDRDDLLRTIAIIGRSVGHAVDLTWHRVFRSLEEPPPGAGPTTRPQRRPLANGVVEQGGEATLARSADPAHDPVLLLRTAAAAAQSGIPIAPATAARLARSSTPLPVPWPGEALAWFVRFIGAGRPMLSVWESLDQAGLITALLPEWERLRSLPQRDPVHLFTVDRHLMQTAVECARLVRSVQRPDLLVLAGLLHDIGKGSGRDHSVAGAEMVGGWLERMGVAKADIETIVVLIRHHLLLSETATRRDPDDPATAATVAAAVGDLPTLELLAALTEADSLAAGPAAWTSWKARQVGHLTARVRAALGGAPPVGLEEPVLELPSDGGTDVSVAVDGDQVTVTVTAPDRPGLLVAVAGALSLQRLTVHGAAVRSARGIAGQRWTAAPEFGDPPDAATLKAEVTRSLADPAGTAARVARRRIAAEHSTAVPPRVDVATQASDTATVIEVRAHDVPGLLHTVAVVVAARGLSVVSAVVHTWGADAVDVLYVQDPQGRSLSPTVAADLVAAIAAALTPAPLQ